MARLSFTVHTSSTKENPANATGNCYACFGILPSSAYWVIRKVEGSSHEDDSPGRADLIIGLGVGVEPFTALGKIDITGSADLGWPPELRLAAGQNFFVRLDSHASGPKPTDYETAMIVMGDVRGVIDRTSIVNAISFVDPMEAVPPGGWLPGDWTGNVHLG